LLSLSLSLSLLLFHIHQYFTALVLLYWGAWSDLLTFSYQQHHSQYSQTSTITFTSVPSKIPFYICPTIYVPILA